MQTTDRQEEAQPVGFDDVLAAARRLEGVAHRTPVLTSSTLDRLTGGHLFLKAENLQRGGAFKFRGAYNKISSLPPGTGVATYSSGNHAQAVALAARLLDSTAVVVMPQDVPPEKLEAARGYGAEVVFYDRYRDDRERIGRELAAARGLTLVPPYEDPLIMAGQGTAALELLQDAGPLDVLLAPIGGGGLMAGSSTAAEGVDGDIRVVGVEPEAGDDTRRSLAAGRRVSIEVPRTIADGLQAHVPGEMTFEVNRRRVDEIVVVSDAEIVGAMRFLFERMKVVVEPSGAVALAAVLARRLDPAELRIGLILSGGNVSAARFSDLMARFPG